MSLVDTCRNIRLEGSTLLAECRTSDNTTYKLSSLSLDTLIGNVDGAFRWGRRNFSSSAQGLSVSGNGYLSAELKTPKGTWELTILDLKTNIRNNNGMLEGFDIASNQVAVDLLAKNNTNGSALAIETSVNGGALGAETAVNTSVVTTSSEKEGYFEENSTMSSKSNITTSTVLISRRTMTMALTESCRNLKLEGAILHTECLLADGLTWKTSTFDLDRHISIVKGTLQWGSSGFSKVSQKFRLEGTHLVVEYAVAGSTEFETLTLDLATKLRNDNGVMIAIAYDAKISAMLTEVPWMKFKVVAEPDFSVIITHPVMKETMAKIAQSTVEHATSQMTSIMNLAIQEAVKVITVSAMEHISQSLEIMSQGIVGGAGMQASASAAGYLHMTGSAQATLGASITAEGEWHSSVSSESTVTTSQEMPASRSAMEASEKMQSSVRSNGGVSVQGGTIQVGTPGGVQGVRVGLQGGVGGGLQGSLQVGAQGGGLNSLQVGIQGEGGIKGSIQGSSGIQGSIQGGAELSLQGGVRAGTQGILQGGVQLGAQGGIQGGMQASAQGGIQGGIQGGVQGGAQHAVYSAGQVNDGGAYLNPAYKTMEGQVPVPVTPY